MESRTATAKDLALVFRGLAGRSRQEYEAAGFNIRKAKDAFLMNLKEGRGHTLLEDGKPVAIIAWEEDGGAVSTSFAAHESFFKASTVRFCKRHVRRIQELCGNLPVHSYSWSDRKDVAKWFRTLGFRQVDSGKNYILFELAPDAMP